VINVFFFVECSHEDGRTRSKHVGGLPHVCASLCLNISTVPGIYSDRKNYIIYFDGGLYVGRRREEVTRCNRVCTYGGTGPFTVRNMSAYGKKYFKWRRPE